MARASAKLTSEQQHYYEEKGYYSPIRVLGDSATADFRNRFFEYIRNNQRRLNALLPREQIAILGETHTFLRWVYRIVSHPNVLDAVESVLGPNVLVWSTRWFPKMPGEKAYISWHQDAVYWGLHPPKVTTAWIALTKSTPENGCMRVLPGSHTGPLLDQIETYAKDNVLSRGQEIAVAADESKARDLILQPGEMSLHHVGIVHGSNRNASKKPRIGIAVRYVSTDVIQDGSVRQFAMLVRGVDDFGYFDLLPSPDDDPLEPEGTIQPEVVRRIATNLLPNNLPKS
jgi:non-heme Fe2+,alpha-ketoglutarate-dependent halogenase